MADYGGNGTKEKEKVITVPRVSVVIPAYNSASTIGVTIASVLAQEIPLEIIIINDGSTDATRDVIRQCWESASRPGVIWKIYDHKTNQGIAASRNFGVSQAEAPYIAFLDSDDWWAPEKLQKQLTLIEESGCVLCSTGREFALPDGTLTGHTVGVKTRITYRDLLHENSISCSSVLIRTDVAKEFPMEHEELHEDYIMWLRVLKKYGATCGIDEPLLKYRRSAKAKTANKLKSAKMHYGSLRYVGIGRVRACYFFCFYAVSGLLKHMGR